MLLTTHVDMKAGSRPVQRDEWHECQTCGLLITPKPDGHCGGTGYGYDVSGAVHCYRCCANRERASMVETGRAVLYLGENNHVVTDWAGHLRFTTTARKRGTMYVPGCLSRVDRVDAWFVGPDGFVWHAVRRGDMDLCRCKRTKRRAA